MSEELMTTTPETKPIICPECKGRGQNYTVLCVRTTSGGYHKEGNMPCLTCDGTGQLSTEAHQRYTDGRAMADDRKARGMTLRREAERLGISPSELSDREWGRKSRS